MLLNNFRFKLCYSCHDKNK
ncbi:MAG: hypothetical protein KGZ81_04935 [Flavobacteriales bacterium]|nr:hypothetical protein [Flavobacteriales bacterium]